MVRFAVASVLLALVQVINPIATVSRAAPAPLQRSPASKEASAISALQVLGTYHYYWEWPGLEGYLTLLPNGDTFDMCGGECFGGYWKLYNDKGSEHSRIEISEWDSVGQRWDWSFRLKYAQEDVESPDGIRKGQIVGCTYRMRKLP